jgi:hypothetical protein
VVDELGDSLVVVLGIRKDFALGDYSTSGHWLLLGFRWFPEVIRGLTGVNFPAAYFGRLAPYLERR